MVNEYPFFSEAFLMMVAIPGKHPPPLGVGKTNIRSPDNTIIPSSLLYFPVH